MTEVRDKVFQGGIVSLDGHAFINCRINDCEIRYSGGEVSLVETSIVGCTWSFGGAALRTLLMLGTFQIDIGKGFRDPLSELDAFAPIAN